MVLFSHTIFYVKSIPETVSFYEKAFGIKPKFVHETKTYAELQTGDTALAFADETLGKENLPEGYLRNDPEELLQGCEIVFSVTDVQKAYDRAVNAGAVAVAPPKKKPWGQIVAYVRDPHGILIEIASQLSKT